MLGDIHGSRAALLLSMYLAEVEVSNDYHNRSRINPNLRGDPELPPDFHVRHEILTRGASSNEKVTTLSNIRNEIG